MNIRDIFNSLNAANVPTSPLLAKYYGAGFAPPSGSYTGADPWGSNDPALQPYQFNFQRAPSAVFNFQGQSPDTPTAASPVDSPIPFEKPDGGESVDKESPTDANVQGSYTKEDYGDMAKGALGIAGTGIGGPIGAAMSLASLAMRGYDVFGPSRDDTAAAQAAAAKGLSFSEMADLDDMMDAVAGAGLGPQEDRSAFGGLGISSLNLDSMSDPSYNGEFGYGIEGIKNALEATFGGGPQDDTAAAEAASGAGFGEMSDMDDAEDVEGGIGSDGDEGDTSSDDDDDVSDEDDAGFALGGLVTQNKLRKPDPPGADTGVGNLQAGEYVIQRSVVDKYGQDFFDALNKTGSQGDDDCVISTALTDTGSWTLAEKRKAVLWCRKTHHDGSLRGRLWVDGYHQWGGVVARLARRCGPFRRLVKACSTAFVGQVTGKKKTPLGFIIKWGWATPLSYAIGAWRHLR